MASFTNEYSGLPEVLYTPHHFREVASAPASVQDLIVQIRNYQAAGNYAAAKEIIDLNVLALAPYMFTSEHINAIEEETRNVEIMAQEAGQSIYYSDSEPASANTIKDVWIGD